MKIAIIGAGLSGLSSAMRLQDAGHEVVLFDKGRSVGGRCATRRTPHGPVDHGLQALDSGDPRLSGAIDGLPAQNIFMPDGQDRPASGDGPFLTPSGGANAFARHLARGLNVLTEHSITGLERWNRGWMLSDPDGSIADADIAILAIPPAQAAAFDVTPDELDLEKPTYKMQVVALIASHKDIGLPHTGPLDADGLGWITRSHLGDRATVFADDAASAALIDTEKDEIAQWIWQRLMPGQPPPSYLKGHRWRYSRVDTPHGGGSFYDAQRKLGYCGDWFIGPDAGDALESGVHLAERIMRDL